MKNKRYFPLYVDLSDKNIVVVGGGTIATRRVKALLLFTRNITVIAPKMTADLWVQGHALSGKGLKTTINKNHLPLKNQK